MHLVLARPQFSTQAAMLPFPTGTVFVHAVANAYGTWATRVRVNVEFEGEGQDEVEEF